jgi:hypothetical protein
MPTPPEDLEQYRAFFADQKKALGCLEFPQEETLWHYTTGDALINILESGMLYATQVSCLNDSTELLHYARLVQKAVAAIRQQNNNNAWTHQLLDWILAAPVDRANQWSPWFVSCFSKNGDDLSQWRAYSGGENGYAIGFRASKLAGQGTVARISYDRAQQNIAAEEIAKATVRFFCDGIEKQRAPSPKDWVNEFAGGWFPCLDELSPMIKDEGFSGEQEYRLIHKLQTHEASLIRLRQRATLMSRHLPLSFKDHPMLPIVEVRVGPCRHKEISRISVNTLLVNKGYPAGLVSTSKIPFQQL